MVRPSILNNQPVKYLEVQQTTQEKRTIDFLSLPNLPFISPPQLIEKGKDFYLFLLSFPHHTPNPPEAMSIALLKCILNLTHLSIYTVSNIIQTTTVSGTS